MSDGRSTSAPLAPSLPVPLPLLPLLLLLAEDEESDDVKFKPPASAGVRATRAASDLGSALLGRGFDGNEGLAGGSGFGGGGGGPPPPAACAGDEGSLSVGLGGGGGLAGATGGGGFAGVLALAEVRSGDGDVVGCDCGADVKADTGLPTECGREASGAERSDTAESDGEFEGGSDEGLVSASVGGKGGAASPSCDLSRAT